MPKLNSFGTYKGQDVSAVALSTASGMEARIIGYGAALQSLKIPAKDGLRSVVLGFEHLDAYVANAHWHLGAVPGRVANRIGGGRFHVDGIEYRLPRNQDDRHTLHGGPDGFGTRVWSLAQCERNSVTLTLVSEDGDQGFPGRVIAAVTYDLLEPATLRIRYPATTDKPTPINLTNHAYFNLDGSGDILGHTLVLESDFYTPTDAELIPTGAIAPVKGTPWDFTTERPIAFETGNGLFHYDANVVLRGSGGLEKAARVVSSKRDLAMETWTTEPGLQFFDSATLAVSAPGLGGTIYKPRAGFCLEPQIYPDAINKPHFPNCVLRPGAAYTHTTEYRFEQL